MPSVIGKKYFKRKKIITLDISKQICYIWQSTLKDCIGHIFRAAD